MDHTSEHESSYEDQEPLASNEIDAKVRRFPCAQCGAKLEYEPGTTVLKCPYCNHENPINDSAQEIEEIDFLAALEQSADDADTLDVMSVKCGACAAEVCPPEGVTAFSCPYCGTNIVAVAGSHKLIKPRSLLPFAVKRDSATDLFQKWLSKRWFAPSDLSRYARTEGKFQGIYVPYWTYDCRTTTFYTGQRGEYYYVTVGSGNNRRRERRTRWYPASGTVRNGFDDLLVLASESLPGKNAEKLEPWDLQNLVPYTPDYLSGFAAESYAIGLKQGFEIARGLMDPVIRSTVCRDIGGDTQRITSMDTRYRDVTFKHLLLPVWICAYRYRTKIYRVLVNARTGEVQGDRPYSWVKITGAVIAGLIAIGIIVYLVNTR